MLTYAVEYSVMNDESFNPFMADSNASPVVPSDSKDKRMQEDKTIQTEVLPTIGDNFEKELENRDKKIAHLQKENSELKGELQQLVRIMQGKGLEVPAQFLVYHLSNGDGQKNNCDGSPSLIKC